MCSPGAEWAGPATCAGHVKNGSVGSSRCVPRDGICGNFSMGRYGFSIGPCMVNRRRVTEARPFGSEGHLRPEWVAERTSASSSKPIWRSTVSADAEASRSHSDDTAALTPLEQRLLRGRGCPELFALSLLDSPEGEVPSRGLVPSLPRQAAGCGAAAHQRRAGATIAEVR